VHIDLTTRGAWFGARSAFDRRLSWLRRFSRVAGWPLMKEIKMQTKMFIGLSGPPTLHRWNPGCGSCMRNNTIADIFLILHPSMMMGHAIDGAKRVNGTR
jgi:hypothetical protein